MSIMTYHDGFCPALPTVYAGKDYKEYLQTLIHADRTSGLMLECVRYCHSLRCSCHTHND